MTYLSNRKNLPQSLTSYDLLKALAVLIMIVDHVGFYFFPEEIWLRLIGRICVPMWFFLVGYARSRDMSPVLWIGGTLLVVMNPVVGLPVFPLNILFTILFVRLVLDVCIQKMLKSQFDTFMGALVLLTVCLPSSYVMEYGTSAVALAFVGYMVRHKEILGFDQQKVIIWLSAITVFFGVSQIFSGVPFSEPTFMFLVGGAGGVIGALYIGFKPKVFTFKSSVLSFLGRYTLEIYVVHLIVFKLIAVSMDMENFQWFHLMLFY